MRVLKHTDSGLRALPPPMPEGHNAMARASLKAPPRDDYAECLAALTMAADRADSLCRRAGERERVLLASSLSSLTNMVLAAASLLEIAEQLEHRMDAADRQAAS